MFNQALILLEDKVMELSGHNSAFYGLTSPLCENASRLSREVLRETNSDHWQLSLYIDQNEPLLVDDQRRAYLSILNKVQSQQIIYISSNRRMKQLMDWLSNPHWIPDTGMLTCLLLSNGMMRPLLPSTALFRGFHLSAGQEKADGTHEPRS